MIFMKEPKLEEITRENFFAIGHVLHYVIIQNEFGNIFFAEDPERLYERNEVFMGKKLLTLELLSLEDQEKILKEMRA